MNDFIEENKKKIVCIIILISLCVLFGIINLIRRNSTKSSSLERSLEDLGSIYYEELLYPYILEDSEDIYKELLDDYKEEGFKVTLEDLFNSIENANKDNFFDSKNNINCDIRDTYILIYPTGYSKEDYRIEMHTDC